VTLGCRAHRTVTTVVRVATAQVLLVVMAPWAGTVGVVSSSLVCSCGGVGAVDVQEPGVEEPSGEEPYVEEPFHFCEVSSDQVENRSKDCVDKRLCHSYRVALLLASIFSSVLLFGLYSKVRALITCLNTNFVD
jgi:hypothetical protein